MNNQINKLFKQAYGFPIDKLTTINLEKFADLIVRECMSNLYLHGYDDARTQIKQHFGVEE